MQSIDCLGVQLDDRLRFDRHVSSVVSKVNFSLRSLYTTSLYLPLFVRERLAHALVLPAILYCLEVYSSASQGSMHRIQVAFNNMIRFVYGVGRRVHITPYVCRFLGCDFPSYVNYRLLLFLFKLLKCRSPIFLVNEFNFCHSTRTNQLVLPRVDNFLSSTFFVRVARLYNSLPTDLKNFSFSTRSLSNRLRLHFQRF